MRKLIDENINTQKLLRIACLLLADIVIINLSAVAALLLRFELSPAPASEAGFMSSVISYMWLNTLVTVIIFWIFGLYNSLWEFAGVHELVRIALASACSGAAVWLGMLLLGLPVPRSYPFIYILVLFVAASFPRFIYRLLRNQRAASKQGTRRRTMLIGGGVKIVLNYNLVALPSVNIHGAPIGTLVCFVIVSSLNLFFVYRTMEDKPNYFKVFAKPLIASLVMAVCARFSYRFFAAHIALGGATTTQIVNVGLAVVLAVIVYVALVLALRIVTRDDLALLPKGEKLARILHVR